MRWLFRELWRLFRGPRVQAGGLRPRGPRVGCYALLFFPLFLLAAVFVLLGGDLETLDRWWYAQAVWARPVGDWLFSIVCGAILLCCLLLAGAMLFPRKSGIGLSAWGLLACLVVGYFAWVGMTMPA